MWATACDFRNFHRDIILSSSQHHSSCWYGPAKVPCFPCSHDSITKHRFSNSCSTWRTSSYTLYPLLSITALQEVKSVFICICYCIFQLMIFNHSRLRESYPYNFPTARCLGFSLTSLQRISFVATSLGLFGDSRTKTSHSNPNLNQWIAYSGVRKAILGKVFPALFICARMHIKSNSFDNHRGNISHHNAVDFTEFEMHSVWKGTTLDNLPTRIWISMSATGGNLLHLYLPSNPFQAWFMSCCRDCSHCVWMQAQLRTGWL